MRVLKKLLVFSGVAATLPALWYTLMAGQAAPTRPFADAFTPHEEFQFDPPKPGSYTLNRFRTAPDGQVLDVNGNTHSLAALTRGKINLVSFVYLMCGDENGCPIAMSTLFEIHDASEKLPRLREDVQLITISFDPARDTVEAINSFSYPLQIDANADQKLKWHVLTSSGMADLQPILDGFGQVIDRSNDQEVINHLLRMYLIDREGVVRNVYGLGTIDPRLLITDVETLLLEESRP
ncbi:MULTISPECIES: SCO family protein [unclassified Pseudovibrio]|uniref:SCO family protein n=1 Tax=unclassified Pseudovibrio TaxID=2627060 RepID=UPI0007AE5C85|nr:MULTISPECIES: SCO family protein [unclassified Pseudovibrio]KZL02377.1 SCO1/SenC [Pseudovibrio sp. W74]KZL08079.1 SCO1/SenC [Pseudovibrio sp. Ad14]